MTDTPTDLELLNVITKLDRRQARLVRDMANQRLRELGYVNTATTPSPWHQPTDMGTPTVAGGAELQRGLEVAVIREQERLDGPDDDCQACEEGKHVGHTTDF